MDRLLYLEEYGSYFQWGDTEAFTYDGVGEISKSELSERCWSYFMMTLGVENKEQVISMVGEMGLELNDDNIIDIFFLLMLEYELNGLTNLTTFGFGFSIDKIFNLDNYFDTTDSGLTFNKYDTDKLTALELGDDAAYVHISSEWRMPTRVEFQELIDNTTLTWIDLQGNEFTQDEAQNGTIIEGNLKGIRLTGSNSNSIFIPAAGNCGMNVLADLGGGGYYWCSGSSRLSSDFSGCLNFDHDGGLSVLDTVRFCGLGVRGVKA